jgi:hypothetical protein
MRANAPKISFSTDFLEELIASIIRAEDYAKKETNTQQTASLV